MTDDLVVTDLDRTELLTYGTELVTATLEESGLPTPAVVVHDPAVSSELGWYRRGQVHVNLPNTRRATKTPGFSWSFPGYKADLTSAGVLAHETGHWVDELLALPRLSGWSGEANVTSYEPNRGERFAEAFKLFVTNPDLLRVGRPVRWKFLLEHGLRPTQLVPWRDVLRKLGAHERFMNAAENWIKRS